MPDGPFNSVILRAATRPSDVESAVSASADEGLDVCVFGSEAQAAHTRRAIPGRANRMRRPSERGERLIVRRLHVETGAGEPVQPGSPICLSRTREYYSGASQL